MYKVSTITERESIAIDIIKAISILSVIAAHVVPLSDVSVSAKIVTSIWNMFARVGVISFFIIGGFLYQRIEGDNKVFWRKKFFRIILPWIFCGTLTFFMRLIREPLPENIEYVCQFYIKWILGSGTWYYYATMYTLFLLVFKWFSRNNAILFSLIIIHVLSLVLHSFGLSSTLPIPFFTDYLNPLYWVGYFSMGILMRRYCINRKILKYSKTIVFSSVMILVLIGLTQYYFRIFTYFHIISLFFCITSFALIAMISYGIANRKIGKYIAQIGKLSYCIYLLHMQIVQSIISRLPDHILILMLAPFIGLAIMLILISIGILVCDKVSFGDKIKKLVGI